MKQGGTTCKVGTVDVAHIEKWWRSEVVNGKDETKRRIEDKFRKWSKVSVGWRFNEQEKRIKNYGKGREKDGVCNTPRNGKRLGKWEYHKTMNLRKYTCKCRK